jgi:hypothetical protein
MMRWSHAWVLALLLGDAGAAMAASPCDPHVVEALGRALKLNHFHLPTQPADAEPNNTLVAADCRADPGHPGLTLVAAVHTSDDEAGHWLALGLVDAASHNVRASLHVAAGEDAALRYEPDSLRLDTARYQLAPGVRAFGLDIGSGYTPNCGNGGVGAMRTLYVVDGNTIRPVLSNLYLTEWVYIQEAQSRCNPNGPETEIVETFARSISLGTESHAGYRDLVIRATSSRDDQRKSGRKPLLYTLRYDGHRYPLTKAYEDAYWAWRR